MRGLNRYSRTITQLKKQGALSNKPDYLETLGLRGYKFLAGLSGVGSSYVSQNVYFLSGKFGNIFFPFRSNAPLNYSSQRFVERDRKSFDLFITRAGDPVTSSNSDQVPSKSGRMTRPFQILLPPLRELWTLDGKIHLGDTLPSS